MRESEGHKEELLTNVRLDSLTHPTGHSSSPMTRRTTRRLALALVILSSACGGAPADPGRRVDSGSGGVGSVKPLTLDVSGELKPGSPIVISGTGAVAGANISIDGLAATVQSTAPGQLTVLVPILRPCETDGRSVVIRASSALGSVVTTAKITTPTLQLAVGESRIVTDPSCVSLPRTGVVYAVSVAGIDPTPTARAGRLDVGVGSSPRIVPSSATPSDLTASPARRRAAASVAPFASAEMPILASSFMRRPVLRRRAGVAARAMVATGPDDPTLASAQVGEVISLPDARSRNATHCSGAYDAMPLKRYVVAAVSGRVVVVVDSVSPTAAVARSDVIVQGGFADGAATVDRLIDGALAEVLGERPQWYGTAGSRIFLVLQNIQEDGSVGSGYGWDNTLRSLCPSSWQLNAVVLDASAHTRSGASRAGIGRQVAHTAIHELTHVIDEVLNRPNPGQRDRGFFSEALAETVVEVAIRQGAGVARGVIGESSIAAGVADRWIATWYQSADSDPLYGYGMARSGWNNHGTHVLMYARQLAGEGSVPRSGTGPTLYQRLMARYPTRRTPSLSDVAAELKVPERDLLDAAALITVTQGLLRGNSTLPQIAAWDAGYWLANAPSLFVREGTVKSETFQIGGGGVWARYLAFGGATGLAVSLTVDRPTSLVRITRLD